MRANIKDYLNIKGNISTADLNALKCVLDRFTERLYSNDCITDREVVQATVEDIQGLDSTIFKGVTFKQIEALSHLRNAELLEGI